MAKEAKSRAPYRYKLTEHAICAADWCRKPFLKRVPHQRFCSGGCRNGVHNQAGWARRRDSASRTCELCGSSFVPGYGSRRIKYCSVDCGAAAKRKIRSGSTNRRRAAKFGSVYEVVNKRKVFERDGWQCYLCGASTPNNLSGTKEPNAPELEHVVPLAHGFVDGCCSESRTRGPSGIASRRHRSGLGSCHPLASQARSFMVDRHGIEPCRNGLEGPGPTGGAPAKMCRLRSPAVLHPISARCMRPAETLSCRGRSDLRHPVFYSVGR